MAYPNSISNTLNQVVNNAINSSSSLNVSDTVYTSGMTNEMKYFNRQLFRDYNPAISGYNLCLMQPPEFNILQEFSQIDQEYVNYLKKISIFNILEFTPPQVSIKNSEITNSQGAIQYASEWSSSYDFSCTFLENKNSDFYNFLKLWTDFINDLLLGKMPVPYEFLNPLSPRYGSMDYVCNFYILKYNNTMDSIIWVGKVLGAFPQTLPTKEYLGDRNTNDLVLLPTNFSCSYFDQSFIPGDQIFNEVNSLLSTYT